MLLNIDISRLTLLNIDISRLTGGNGLEEITHSPKWDKTCYVICNAGKTERARKRKEKVSQELPHSPVQTAPTQHKHSLMFYENSFWRGAGLVFLWRHHWQPYQLPRLRPCPLILVLDKSPKNSEILNCLPSCQVGNGRYWWSVSFKVFDNILWQRKVSEKTLEWSTTSYKRRGTCICWVSVLHKEIWPDRWKPKMSSTSLI